MEKILMSAFGGGTLDWEEISHTKYDWDEIFDRVESKYTTRIVDINDLYYEILQLALEEIEGIFENCSDEKFKNYLKHNVDVHQDFEIYANSLDSRIDWCGDDYIGEQIEKFFKDEFEEVNKNIGFTYIRFN